MLFYLIKKPDENLFMVLEKSGKNLAPQCVGVWPNVGEPKKMLDALLPLAKTTYLGCLHKGGEEIHGHLVLTKDESAIPHKWVNREALVKDNLFVAPFLANMDNVGTVDGQHRALSRILQNGPMTSEQIALEFETSAVEAERLLDLMVEHGWLNMRRIHPAKCYLPTPASFIFSSDKAFSAGILPTETAWEYMEQPYAT